MKNNFNLRKVRVLIALAAIGLAIWLCLSLIEWLFSVSIFVDIPYRNRITGNCLFVQDNHRLRQPPWFWLLYKEDKSCEIERYQF